MPTLNEGLGTSGVVWTAWRFAAVPRGIAAERLKFLEGAIEVAMHDRELAEIDRFSQGHREFLTKTGRITP